MIDLINGILFFFPRIRTFQVIDECSQRQLLLNASCCRYNPKKCMFYFLVEESHSLHLDWETEILLHHLQKKNQKTKLTNAH